MNNKIKMLLENAESHVQGEDASEIAEYALKDIRRDNKRRSLKLEIDVRGAHKESLRLNGFHIRRSDDVGWEVGIHEFTAWIESRTDYDIE